MVANALAGIAVGDLDGSVEWYTRLLDRGPDALPMDELAEWKFPQGGWIQVFEDSERAGKTSVTLVVASLDERLSDLESKGIGVVRSTDGDDVRTATVADPDGNQVVFAQSVGGAIESSTV